MLGEKDTAIEIKRRRISKKDGLPTKGKVYKSWQKDVRRLHRLSKSVNNLNVQFMAIFPYKKKKTNKLWLPLEKKEGKRCKKAIYKLKRYAGSKGVEVILISSS